MLQLVMMMMLAAAPPGQGPGIGEKIQLRDRLQGAMPVTDKFLIPARPPNCKNADEEQLAIEQIRNGELGQCFVRVQPQSRRR